MRIFEEQIEQTVVLNQENAHHVAKVMRCRVGDCLIICDGKGLDYDCVVSKINGQTVVCTVESHKENRAELPVKVTVFAGLSKGDRFEIMLQKCIELGAYEIVPFFSENCVIKLDAKDCAKKVERYQKIARDGAKQSGRGIIPKVCDILTFAQVCTAIKGYDLPLFLYECEREHSLYTNLAHKEGVGTIAIVSGPEGGFSAREAQMAQAAGMVHTTLGNRILRCETAPMAALAGIATILEK